MRPCERSCYRSSGGSVSWGTSAQIAQIPVGMNGSVSTWMISPFSSSSCFMPTLPVVWLAKGQQSERSCCGDMNQWLRATIRPRHH